MSKNVVLTLESRFIDEYGEYANLPVFSAHGSIVGYVGGEVPESGNPCEFNRLDDEGFTYCASATEVVRLKAENAKLRELVLKNWYIALSEREALMVYGINPDGGVYIAALDDEIAIARDRMRELGALEE